MKTPTSKTTEVSAPDKANSTPMTSDYQRPGVLSETEKELLFVIGNVAGSYIAAYLHQRHCAQVNPGNRRAL